jgi:AraC-like DNA-binding protein
LAVSASVLSVSSRALIAACARLGLDTDQILAAARLEHATIDDSDARIPVEQMQALWRKAYELSKDPDLALHAIEVLPFGAYRVIDFLAGSAPTIGAAIAKVSDYFPLVNNVVRLSYEVGHTFVAVRLEPTSAQPPITRPYAEYTLAAVFLRTRIATNHRYRLVRVEFSHPRPDNTREHERIFECPVAFDENDCRIVMTRAIWDTPRTGSDPALFSVLESHAKMLLDQLPNASDVMGRVRDAIDAELRGGSPRLESVARRLAMSPRTLQRRLTDEGVQFNDVLDQMRLRAAKTYLAKRDVASAEVAYLLGFAEQSSFNHAFKRWTGQTPTEFRRAVAR